jgi:hypothetical protein
MRRPGPPRGCRAIRRRRRRRRRRKKKRVEDRTRKKTYLKTACEGVDWNRGFFGRFPWIE